MQELDAELWRKLAPLLDHALDLSHAERNLWLQTLSRESPELGRELGALLEEQELADQTGFLERFEVADLAGMTLGAYRLERPLGEGGMGAVWLAERCDGQFEGAVAIKLLHLSAIGASGLARFKREGSALARLTHASIARLLDAGVSPTGQPYLILEYVDGRPIDAFANARRLGRRERIELLLRVLAAVEHAHNNLVVHRDLKPSNILVTADGSVKLLDFGIAKLLDEHAAGAATSQDGRAFTPLYAAPEQLRGEPLSAATDVYALGVLLYWLLAARHPTSQGAATPAECLRSILEVEPVALGMADLDNILAKALSKDAVSRYPSAAAFADDLKRYLAGAPVLARPGSTAYRLGKFLRRHWARVLLASVIALALVTAAGISLWQARVAEAQEAAAQREAKRASLMLKFLLDLFAYNSDQGGNPPQARELTARQLLDIGAERAMQQLGDDPELQAEALNHIADMFAQLKLGEQAGRLRLRAIEALKQVHGAQSMPVADALLGFAEDVAYTNGRALAAGALAEATAILDHLGDHSSEARGATWLISAQLARYHSLQTMSHAAEQARHHFREYPPREFWSGPYKALQLAGLAQALAGHFQEAEALQRQAIADIEPRVEHAAAWRINPLIHIAAAQYGRGDLGSAISTQTEALGLSRQVNGGSNGQTLQTQAKLAGYLYAGGRREEGLALFDATLAELQRKPPSDLAGAWGSLRQFRGISLLREGRIEEADRDLANELRDLRQYYPDSTPLARVLVLHAEVSVALGRYESARSELDEGCRLWQEHAGNVAAPAMANDCWLGRAQLALAQGRTGEALQWLERVTALPEPALVQLDRARANLELARARLLQRDGAGAEQAARTVLAALDAAPQLHAHWLAAARLRLGQALRLTGATAGAVQELDAAVSGFAAHGHAQSPWLAEAQRALAECLLEARASNPGALEQARALLSDVQAARGAHPELGAHVLGG
jgi:hypothetical protein